MGSSFKIIGFLIINLITSSYAAQEEIHQDDVENKIELITHGYYPSYPPTHATTQEQQALVKKGEYLAKIGDCLACHTNVKDKTPSYAGGLPIETPFGTFYSPNITPDKKTGIGNWTEQDFIRALKKGRDPKGRNYFPVFPYVYFANITDEDAKALYAYFMSIPAVELQNKPLPFPFNVPGSRLSLWGWNLLFFFPNDEPLKYDSEKSPQWNRGKYIVDGLGHCSMCHTPLNVFGAPKRQYYLTGEFINGYWAPNITKHGLETVDFDELSKVFTENQLINNAGPVAGPMLEVNNNSLVHLTKEDQFAIYTYLKSVESDDPLFVQKSNEKPNLRRGKEVYTQTCIICHQDGKMSAPLLGNGPSWYQRLKDSGLDGLYKHAKEGFNSMPYKGACVSCSDNDVIAAVDYILNESLSRSQWKDIKNANNIKSPINGQLVYEENCSVCHKEGKLSAPKIGDKKVWSALVNKNIDVLIQNTISSKNHPQNGGCSKCSTGEIIEAIKYMVSQSGVEGNYTLW